MVNAASRADGIAQPARCVGDQIVQVGALHGARCMRQLFRRGQVDQHRQPLLAGVRVQLQILEVLDELMAVGQAADRVDAPQRVLQFDLRHHHTGHVAQCRQLLLSSGAWFGAQYTNGAKTVAVAGDERRTRVVADAAGRQQAVAVVSVFAQVGQDQHVAAVGHLAARRAHARDGVVLHADARLEPLAVGVRQRHGGNRQLEQVGGGAGDAVECFAGRCVQQVQFMERVEAAGFVLLANDGHVLQCPGLKITQYCNAGRGTERVAHMAPEAWYERVRARV